MHESNLAMASSGFWWPDSRATNHITYTLQELITKKKPNKEESKLVIGNNEEVEVKFVGIAYLNLDSDFILVLNNTFYVLSFR